MMHQLFFTIYTVITKIRALFGHEEKLHTARFARTDELAQLISTVFHETSLLLGTTSFQRLLRVAQTQARRELGNPLVVAPTRGGKGLLATSQLLSWPRSVIINDIKGELFAQTAGYR